MKSQSSNSEVQRRVVEIQEYARLLNKSPQQVFHLFLGGKCPRKMAQDDSDLHARPVDFGLVRVAMPDEKQPLAMVLERLLQGAWIDRNLHTALYRQGYINKPLGGRWGITDTGKALINRFKIITNEGEVIGENVRVAKSKSPVLDLHA